MNAESERDSGYEAVGSEFEQRLQTLLRDSAENLPAAVRSRLTQARYAALARPAARLPWLRRRWLPVGAVAALALAFVVVIVPRVGIAPVNPVAAVPEDIELLTDSDAMPLNADQDVDYDFYEWAASEASAAGSLVGT